MFKFIRGNKEQSDNEARPVEQAIAEASQDETTNETEDIETTLSIPDSWNMTEEEQYVYAFHNSQSPTLKVNQVSIYGMELIQNGDGSIRITGLIRSTVTQTVSFGETTILLLDKDEKPIARKKFDLEKLGNLPQNSARPWDFVFTKDDFIQQLDIMPSEWTLAFQLETKHRLDLEESWEKGLNDNAKKQLAKIVEEAAPLKKGEVNFLGFSAKLNEQGELVVSLFIRNGHEQDITIQQLPLGIRDATQEEVARGTFKLDDLTVKANTSKPWTFIFPKSMVKKESIDLSRWAAYPIQD